MANFLILLILHFIGDFYFQTSRIAKCKNANISENCNSCNSCKAKALFNNKFVIIHTLLYAVPFLFLFLMTKWTNAMIIIAAVLVSHYIIDLVACCLNKKLKQTLVFVILHRQLLFILSIMALISAISSSLKFCLEVNAAMKTGSEPPKLSFTTFSLCIE